jgi:acetolactate synthase-1/2/3 large subunit
MNGAESLVQTLTSQGVDICFANPGTSEMHFLKALENPKMRSVLCLFEGVCTGAADGYYRMKGTPASTLLHLGPGLANGLANIHNAKRASSGMVNIVGEHSRAHLQYDPPLTSDIEGLARPLSHWVRTVGSAQAVAWDVSTAIARASEQPGQIATLILPGDASWLDAGEQPILPPVAVNKPKAPDTARVEHIARRYCARVNRRWSFSPARPPAGARSSWQAASRLPQTAAWHPVLHFAHRTRRRARHPGAHPVCGRASARVSEGFQAHHHSRDHRADRLLQLSGQAEPAQGPRHQRPRAGRAGRGFGHRPRDAARCARRQGCVSGAAATRRSDRAERCTEPGQHRRRPRRGPAGELHPGRRVAHHRPRDHGPDGGRAARHDLINNMGGSIGYATPVATGAALACPDRRVFCMVGDGSAMYTIQSLWTQAREGLNITTIIFANNSYAILKAEYANMGAGAPGPQALAMIDIDRPSINWLAMAKSMGVPAVSVDSAEGFHKAMVDSTREQGPTLIEVRL